MARVHESFNQRSADKTRTTGNNDFHRIFSFRLQISKHFHQHLQELSVREIVWYTFTGLTFSSLAARLLIVKQCSPRL
jgi:hypothetical protein